MKSMKIMIALVAIGVCGSLSLARAADKMDEEVKEAIEAFKKADKDIEEFFKSAKGYAVFPGVAKGGIGIGAARGKGQVFEGEKQVGNATLTQASIGFQLGGQVYSEVIFFETEKALEDFKASKMEFSAQVSAVAAAEGASKNAKYQLGVAVFTLAKGGLMYEASVGGQKFKFEPKK